MNKILEFIICVLLILFIIHIISISYEYNSTLLPKSNSHQKCIVCKTTHKYEPNIILPTLKQLQEIIDNLPNYLSDEQKEKCLNKIIDKEVREIRALIH